MYHAKPFELAASARSSCHATNSLSLRAFFFKKAENNASTALLFKHTSRKRERGRVKKRKKELHRARMTQVRSTFMNFNKMLVPFFFIHRPRIKSVEWKYTTNWIALETFDARLCRGYVSPAQRYACAFGRRGQGISAQARVECMYACAYTKSQWSQWSQDDASDLKRV